MSASAPAPHVPDPRLGRMADANPSSRFGAGLSTAEDSAQAIEKAVGQALTQLGPGGPPDLAILFASAAHTLATGDRLAERVRAACGARVLVGCTGSGVMGAGREEEERVALSVWVARLPHATLQPFHLSPGPAGESHAAACARWTAQLPEAQVPSGQLPLTPSAASVCLLFAHPGTPGPLPLLEAVRTRYGGETPVVGGLVSGAPESARVFVQGLAESAGASGVLIGGQACWPVVSQGCRPIGRRMVITRADEHVIFEIGQKPALLAFRDALNDLNDADKELAEQSLHVGRVVDEHKIEFERGDFLVRNPTHFLAESGAVVLGDPVRAGQTIQLHVRDAAIAAEDLIAQLEAARASSFLPRGALLFSCVARGKNLFKTEHHDSRVVHRVFGADLPLAGVFCAGEFGPIGGKSFVHGYTSALLLFG